MNFENFTTTLVGFLTDDYSTISDMETTSDMSLHTTEKPFFKPNMTFKKFFNVSIPIEEKINIDQFNNTEIVGKINTLDILPPIHPSTNFLLFLSSLIFAMFWVTYITFFNSRLVGSIATKIANRYLSQSYPGAYCRVGSFSFSVLAGKIMFRDIVFLTPDWSFRSQDGYIIFRWWRSYVPKVNSFIIGAI